MNEMATLPSPRATEANTGIEDNQRFGTYGCDGMLESPWGD